MLNERTLRLSSRTLYPNRVLLRNLAHEVMQRQLPVLMTRRISSHRVPAEAPAKAPTETLAKAPAKAPTETLAKAPAETLAKSTSVIPAEALAEAPAKTLARRPATAPATAPAMSPPTQSPPETEGGNPMAKEKSPRLFFLLFFLFFLFF